jgi:uncharacterized protein GlcG (DUF336 family)
MTGLRLEQAAVIVDTALARGRAAGMLPLTVVVLDAGGHPIALKREDGSGILRADVALGKAWGALGMGQSSRTLRDRLADRPTFVNALAAAAGGRFIPVPGGVLVRGPGGDVVGAVGVSGDTSDKDEYCAIEGVKAVGLRPDPGEPSPAWADSRL